MEQPAQRFVSWRKRVGVEPTIRPAKDRIAGFEGRGSHRTPFASGGSITGEKNGFGTGIRMNWRCAWTFRSLRGALLAAQALSPRDLRETGAPAEACAPGSGWRRFDRCALGANQ